MSKSYIFFWKGPFSQWHPSGFSLEDQIYVCAEQYMMQQKALLFEDTNNAEKIVACTDPRLQKSLGRNVDGFDNCIWDAQKQSIVMNGNFAKFDQNKGLRRKLFQTGEALLAEASPLDVVWGIGLSEEQAKLHSPADWPGQNLLGEILTSIREQLKSKYSEEYSTTDKSNDMWRVHE